MRTLLPLVLIAAAAPGLCAGQVRVAFFYRPPVDHTTARFLATHAQLILLTHGDEGYMAELRHAGYKGPILQYVTANQAEGPGPYANAKAPCDISYPPYPRTIADLPGMFCRDIDAHESWFLHNRKGERLWSRYQSGNGVWRTSYEMNPASPGWRHFLVHRLAAYRQLGYDGFFLDNVDLSLAGILHAQDSDGAVAEFPNQAGFRAAVAQELAMLRAAFPHLPLWANLTHDPETAGGWAPFLRSLDGVMVEDFALGWTTYPLSAAGREIQFASIRHALALGKGVILVEQGTRQKNAANVARLRFGLASYWALREEAGEEGKDKRGERRERRERGERREKREERANPRIPSGLYFRYADASYDDYRTMEWHKGYDFHPPADPVPRLDLKNATATLPASWSQAWKHIW